jgi:hypothetical protein
LEARSSRLAFLGGPGSDVSCHHRVCFERQPGVYTSQLKPNYAVPYDHVEFKVRYPAVLRFELPGLAVWRFGISTQGNGKGEPVGGSAWSTNLPT